MKRVLITGGAGFIGHHVIEHLLKTTDWEIVSMDRLGISGNYHRLNDIEVWKTQGHRVKLVHHDLRSPVNAHVAADIGKVHYVLHLAASTHVDRSISDPMAFVLDNVVATTNLLMWAKDGGMHRGRYIHSALPADPDGGFKEEDGVFMYFSTDEVFGPAPEGTRYKEWDRYNSGNPYAAGKAGGEEMCLAFSNTYRLPVIITHTMNVFGERQHPEKFIPMCIKKIQAGETVKIHANKDRTKAGSRFWIHGRNVAAALTFLLNRVYLFPENNGPIADKFNIVGEKEVDNLTMAQTIAKILGKELKYEMVDFHSSRPGHDLRYALDGTKMQELGWDLPVDFEESLRKTVEWTINNPNWL